MYNNPKNTKYSKNKPLSLSTSPKNDVVVGDPMVESTCNQKEECGLECHSNSAFNGYSRISISN
jgi:hypothetical protein